MSNLNSEKRSVKITYAQRSRSMPQTLSGHGVQFECQSMMMHIKGNRTQQQKQIRQQGRHVMITPPSPFDSFTKTATSIGEPSSSYLATYSTLLLRMNLNLLIADRMVSKGEKTYTQVKVRPMSSVVKI